MTRRQTQGKCDKCRVRYVWHGRPLLKLAICPTCLSFLGRTSRFLKRYRVVTDVTPHEYRGEVDPVLDWTATDLQTGAIVNIDAGKK